MPSRTVTEFNISLFFLSSMTEQFPTVNQNFVRRPSLLYSGTDCALILDLILRVCVQRLGSERKCVRCAPVHCSV